MLHAHVVGRDGREGRQTCKWQWTELTYVSSRMLTSAARVLWNRRRPVVASMGLRVAQRAVPAEQKLQRITL